MKFKELINLSDDQVGRIDIDELILSLPNTPVDVLEQFYQDHGRNFQFQEQYAELNIYNLDWQLMNLTFEDMSDASV